MAVQSESGAAPDATPDATSDAAPVPPSREAEIEAVLSSIRRLTAEASGLAEPPWSDAERAEAGSPEAHRPGPEALVLTSEQRVEGPALGRAPPLALREPVAAPPAPGGEEDAALRALVARAVREELHGALGRSLTAAVRKLVRQEVHRVLAARERR